jgi:hypothetical protein
MLGSGIAELCFFFGPVVQFPLTHAALSGHIVTQTMAGLLKIVASRSFAAIATAQSTQPLRETDFWKFNEKVEHSHSANAPISLSLAGPPCSLLCGGEFGSCRIRRKRKPSES